MTKSEIDYPIEPDDEIADETSVQQTKLKEPLGVNLIAILGVIGGIYAFVVMIPLFSKMTENDQVLESLGVTPKAIFFVLLLYVIMGFSSSVGLGMGRQWGWWLAATYYLFGVLRHGSSIISVMSMAEQLEQTSRGFNHYLLRSCGRTLIHFWIFYYLLKDHVLAYFQFPNVPKWKLVKAVFRYCCIVSLIVFLITFIF